MNDLVHPPAVSLRPARTADADRLLRLAELDSKPLPDGPHLVAEREGVIEAAISLRTGAVVANPFVPTAELCELLRIHAGIARRAGTSAPPAVRARPIAAPA